MSPYKRSESLLETRAAKLDRVFAALFLVQWLAAISGVWMRSGSAEDLFTAIVIGAAIATVPTALIVWRPGAAATRHAVAVAQMLYGTLIVHLTGGKLGTPYHVFVSLAFLALYSDWRVIVTAVGVVLFDTVGVGLLSSEIAPARWAQQLGWVAIAAGCLGVIARRASQDLVLASRAEAPRGPMTLIVGTPAVEAANDDSTKIVVPNVASLDEMGSAPTLRPRAISAIFETANELSIFSDLEGEPGMDELLQSFVQRLRDTAAELETTENPADLEHVACRLRAAAGSYGFAEICAGAGEIELACREQTDVSAKVAHLASLCRRARSRRPATRAA